MSTRKAKGWKRTLVAFGAVACLALAVLMTFVPNGETFFRHTGKWLLAALLGLGGVWFAAVALRGDARQIDKTLDEMSSGL
ncbi:MAG: hypothetical protein ACO1QS_02370 [Verrucomicrobiota bacterium]